MIGAYVLFGLISLLSYIVSQTLQSKFKKYSGVPLGNGMTGMDVAEKMLHDHGIFDVKVVSVDGQLTDHYNPMNKTVNLSSVVYSQRSVAAAAVAAHECGHAVQHATSYPWLNMRSKIVPVVSFASQWVQWVLLAGIALLQVFPALLAVGIVLFGFTTLFSFITLPVEINASSRAIKWLEKAGIVDNNTKKGAVDALKWAAYTYVIAALSSLATLIYYLLIFLRNRK